MKVVFVSNFYNHHQAPFSREMNRLTNGKFWFIENERLSEERKKMGWGEKEIPSFVKKAYLNDAQRIECVNLINDADVVIFENSTRNLILNRLESGKLTFLYSERYFKSGYELWKLPIRWVTWHKVFGKFKNHYLLCASAYTATDFAITFNYLGKAYKWGYFPEVNHYDINKLMEKKLSFTSNSSENPCVSILWAGRLIGLKHPDASIHVAAALKKKGYSFMMNIIGNGEMEQQLMKIIDEYQLSDCVKMLGAMTPDKVREHMEQADIYLFTSDFNEGWGAVLNESMNSGCAVVASHAIGSVPFLVEDGVNGLIYENGNESDLIKKVEFLLENAEARVKIGRTAYKTMVEIWNAENAAARLLELSNDLLKKGKSTRYEVGPCSKARLLKNGWYKA